MSLHSDLVALKGKLENVEREQRLVRSLLRETLDAHKRSLAMQAEFHAGASALLEAYGPAAGLSKDQIQPLSGGEDKPPVT